MAGWQDLANATYRYRGFVLHAMRLLFGDKLYDRDTCIQYYTEHNERVVQFFAQRPNDLLVLNVAAPDSHSRLCRFLGFPDSGVAFPHANRSDYIQQ